ncbi:MAG: hypothetical protein CM15mV124_170 [uncultured marine virus]|nr:MAG: hypothetical protein CM15mV124_170 [uncultured marine virus]
MCSITTSRVSLRCLWWPRQIKSADFDEKVDILPVADPNIMSMAQRVTLAQTQLQIAQTNPQIHNIHEAYRRVYEALGSKKDRNIAKTCTKAARTNGSCKRKRKSTTNEAF